MVYPLEIPGSLPCVIICHIKINSCPLKVYRKVEIYGVLLGSKVRDIIQTKISFVAVILLFCPTNIHFGPSYIIDF